MYKHPSTRITCRISYGRRSDRVGLITLGNHVGTASDSVAHPALEYHLAQSYPLFSCQRAMSVSIHAVDGKVTQSVIRALLGVTRCRVAHSSELRPPITDDEHTWKQASNKFHINRDSCEGRCTGPSKIELLVLTGRTELTLSGRLKRKNHHCPVFGTSVHADTTCQPNKAVWDIVSYKQP